MPCNVSSTWASGLACHDVCSMAYVVVSRPKGLWPPYGPGAIPGAKIIGFPRASTLAGYENLCPRNRRGCAVSVDTSASMDWAAETVGAARRRPRKSRSACVLIAGGAALDRAIDDILDATAGGTPHILNLGHGILQETPIAQCGTALARVRSASGYAGETRCCHLQPWRTGFARSGRAFSAQSVFGSRHHRPARIVSPAAWPLYRQAPRTGGAEDLCPSGRPLSDLRGDPCPGATCWRKC